MLHEHDGARGLGRTCDRMGSMASKTNGACACAKLYLCTNQTLVGFLKRRFIRVCLWVRVLWVGYGISYQH